MILTDKRPWRYANHYANLDGFSQFETNKRGRHVPIFRALVHNGGRR
jgi:hypothetical protein